MGWTVKVCAKAGIGRKMGHKKRIFEIFKKMSRNRKFLIVQGESCKIIDVVRRKLCFVTI